MADRVDFFSRQRLTDADLDLALELLENADRNFVADLGPRGVLVGVVPSPHAPVADLQIDLTGPALAYDGLGRRISFERDQTVDCSVDLSGAPTAVTLVGNERWLGVFLRFDRSLEDPRADGNGQQVFFRRNEAFEIVVRMAPEAPAGTAPRVPLEPNEVLLCDVRLAHGQTQIGASDIHLDRRETFTLTQAQLVSIDPGSWTILAPVTESMQAALDEVDAELSSHVSGTDHRHTASAIDHAPHAYVTSTNVQSAIDEIVDDLAANSAGNAGASRIGADSVAGSPNALTAGTVDAQLASLLGLVNAHRNASTGAHPASAIGATAHTHVTSTDVQGQLQEIVAALAATTSDSSGAHRIGAAPHNFLTSTSVAGQLQELLSALGSKVTLSGASRVGVADVNGKVNSTSVESSIAETIGAFDDGHFRADESNAGLHRAIVQPALGADRVLIWDCSGNGTPEMRFRIYMDVDNVWFTINASWTGTEWVKTHASFPAAGIRVSRHAFEIVCENTTATSWEVFPLRWTLSMIALESWFQTAGPMIEVGRLALDWINGGSTVQTLVQGGAVNYRTPFAVTPSSLTFTPTSADFVGNPNPWDESERGFGYYSFQTFSPHVERYWYGQYTAIG